VDWKADPAKAALKLNAISRSVVVNFRIFCILVFIEVLGLVFPPQADQPLAGVLDFACPDFFLLS